MPSFVGVDSINKKYNKFVTGKKYLVKERLYRKYCIGNYRKSQKMKSAWVIAKFWKDITVVISLTIIVEFGTNMLQ